MLNQRQIKYQMQITHNLASDIFLENSNEKIRQEIEGKATLSKSYYKISFMGITQLFDGSKIYTIILKMRK